MNLHSRKSRRSRHGAGAGAGAGNSVNFTFDALGRLHAAIDIGYRKQGGGGMSGRLAGLLAVVLLLLPLLAASPAALANETLTYDANGNIQTRTLSGGTTTYGYDALDRVTSEAGPAKTQNLTYDPNDNRLTDGAGSKTYTANTDRIVTENGQSFTLDAAGNVTQARGLNFVWNQRAAQVKTVSQGATLLASYFYDYKGRRTRKVTTAAAPQGAGTVIYAYDLHDRLKGEFDGAGNPLRTYVWRDDAPVAIIVHGTSEVALYLETDHLNTPIAARDQSGKVVWKWESDAFGTTLPNEDPDGDTVKVTINLRFPGQYFDRESGLHYNWNRYYDPRLGRYLSPDPVGLAGGTNPYAFVGGNPISRTDPEGLDWLDNASNYSAGFGDTLSFGLTSYIRDQWDIGGVDKCSGAYAAGMYSELGLEVGLTGASFALRAAAKNISQAAARRGQNWHGARGVSAVHHINPLKQGMFPTAALPQAIRNSRLNLQLLTTAEHTAAHANLVRHEKYLTTAFNPVTTAARGATAAANQCGCQ